jgi:hypothetical protein
VFGRYSIYGILVCVLVCTILWNESRYTLPKLSNAHSAGLSQQSISMLLLAQTVFPIGRHSVCLYKFLAALSCSLAMSASKRVAHLDPVRVSILPIGKHNNDHWWIEKYVRESGFPCLKWGLLGDLPKDPAAGGVSKDENGRFDNTITRVMGQERFATAIEQLLLKVVQKSKTTAVVKCGGLVVMLECSQARHRADVAARQLDELLSSFRLPGENDDSIGPRLFSPMLFITSETRGIKGLENLVENSVRWIDEPWPVTFPAIPEKESDRYGFAACRNDPVAARNFQAMVALANEGLEGMVLEEMHDWQSIQDFYTDLQHEVEQKKSTSDSQSGGADQHDDDTSADGEPQQCATKKSSTIMRPQAKARAPPPPPPPLPPPEHLVSQHHQQVQSSSPFVPAQPLQPPPAGMVQARQSSSHSSVGSSAQSVGLAQSTPMPDWATFEFDPTKWWEVLDEYGIDMKARQLLFLIAGLEGGKREANKIIRRLIYQSYNGTIDNPSGFVHAGAHHARKKLAPEEFDGDDQFCREHTHGSSNRKRKW